MYIHGGGWVGGDHYGPANFPFAAQGYFTVSMEYRLSTEAAFPAQIHDCKAAVRWLRANARQYNINPDKIGVWGTSAGGHLAALLGTSANAPELEGKGGSNHYSSSVQAVVDLFGGTDFSGIIGRTEYRLYMEVAERLVGGPLEEKEDVVRMANPIFYIRNNAPPFLIIHGERDQVVPFDQSQILYDALKRAGVEVSLIKVKDARHGFMNIKEPIIRITRGNHVIIRKKKLKNPDANHLGQRAEKKKVIQETYQLMLDFFRRHLDP
jgi:acetyl esterase/lipase